MDLLRLSSGLHSPLSHANQGQFLSYFRQLPNTIFSTLLKRDPTTSSLGNLHFGSTVISLAASTFGRKPSLIWEVLCPFFPSLNLKLCNLAIKSQQTDLFLNGDKFFSRWKDTKSINYRNNYKFCQTERFTIKHSGSSRPNRRFLFWQLEPLENLSIVMCFHFQKWVLNKKHGPVTLFCRENQSPYSEIESIVHSMVLKPDHFLLCRTGL